MRTTRFISMYGNLLEHVRPLIQEAYATGLTKVLQEQIICDFHPEGVLPHERQLAMDKFAFRGLYQEQDEVTTVAPDYRISVYDTDVAALDRNWSSETKTEVEQKLSEIAARFDYILVAPKTSTPPPWPRYDDYQGTLPQLSKKLVREGHDLEAVLDYERATQNRSEVVLAIEQLLADPEGRLAPVEEEIVG